MGGLGLDRASYRTVQGDRESCAVPNEAFQGFCLHSFLTLYPSIDKAHLIPEVGRGCTCNSRELGIALRELGL